jgi:hypothetical protein
MRSINFHVSVGTHQEERRAREMASDIHKKVKRAAIGVV